MKWFVKIILFASVLALVVSGAMTLYYYNRIANSYSEETSNVLSENPEYHFSLILNYQEDGYWDQFIEGVSDTASKNNILIEFNPTTYTDSEDMMIEYLDIAEKSMLDGIIINGVSTDEYSAAITKAVSSGMSVVLAGDEPVEDSKLCYVGTNFYEFGVQAAKLISQIGEEVGEINLAVILPGDDSDAAVSNSLTHESTILVGLNSAIQDNYEINFVTTRYRQSELLGAEDLTREILNEYKDINVIFCTNAKDTLAAAKVLIERNLVGEVFIVGTNVNEEIISMIDKGIIYGVLDRNGYLAGQKSVEALINNIEGNFQSSFVDIDIEIYTAINIHKYKED